MISSNDNTSSRSSADARLNRGLLGLGLVMPGVMGLLGLFLLREAAPFLLHVPPWRLFTDPSWNPLEQVYNVLPMLVGTLLVSTGALLLAAPLGIISAIFCRFYAPAPLARAYRGVLELLGGVPSVVFGLWGMMALVPLLSRLHPPGASLLAGMLVLALMLIPTLLLLADAAFAQVPADYLQAAAALGLSRWATVRGVVLPITWRSVRSGMHLQFGRAVGETTVVLMVCGNVVQVPSSIFSPIRTVTANIALEMSYAQGDHRAALFSGGLVFVLLILLLVFINSDEGGVGRRRD